MDDNKNKKCRYFKINFDGGVRSWTKSGSQAPGAAGFVVWNGGKIIDKGAEFSLGLTNNEWEYKGAILSLQWASAHCEPGDNVQIFGDSQLIIRQLSGEYKCRDPKLVPLNTYAGNLVCELRMRNIVVEFNWVRREFNREADAVCNEVLDGVLR